MPAMFIMMNKLLLENERGGFQLDLKWVVEPSNGGIIVGIMGVETNKVDQVSVSMFGYDAEIIRLALELQVDPKEFYRSRTDDPRDIMKSLITA